jgi:peptidyl-prolyl cis-trans isomerase D
VAFNELAISNRAISDPIEIGPNHVVFVRVVDHRPSAPRPLEAVRDEVVAAMKAEEAAKATLERARELEHRFVAGETLDAIAAELSVPVESANGAGRRSLEVDRSILDEAFKAPRPIEDSISRIRAQLADGGQVLIEVLRVADGDPAAADEAARNAARQQLASAKAAEETRAFIAALRAATTVEIVEERLR